MSARPVCASLIPSIDDAAVTWVDAAEMREIDRLMTAELGVTLTQMMENAGAHLADLTRTLHGPATVTVVVGGGGNAGGGLVAARHLHNFGVDVTVVPLVAAGAMSLTARMQLQIVGRLGIRISGPDSAGVFRDTVVIDTILGYGLDRDLSPDLVSVIASMQQSPIVSLDVPTGFDATHGTFRNGSVQPAATLALCLPKIGLEDRTAVGDLYLADISVPPFIVERFGPRSAPPFALGHILHLRPDRPTVDMARSRYEQLAIETLSAIDGVVDEQWRALGEAGTWLDGSRRRAEVQAAREPVGAISAEPRSIEHVARLVARHASTLTADTVDAIEEVGIDRTTYVEIVGIVSRVAAIDTFDRGISRPPRELPDATGGPPSREPVADARRRAGWVPTVGAIGPPTALTSVRREAADQEARRCGRSRPSSTCPAECSGLPRSPPVATAFGGGSRPDSVVGVVGRRAIGESGLRTVCSQAMANAQPARRVATPPKVRSTPRRPRTVEESNRRATAGWIGVGLAIAAVLAVLVYVTKDVEPSSPHSGAVVTSFAG